MSIQKKILPLLGLLALTQNNAVAKWWDAPLSTPTNAWDENKGTFTTAAQNAWQQNQGKIAAAAATGAKGIAGGENFSTAVDNAQTTFENTQNPQTATTASPPADQVGLQQQAQAKLTAFKQLPNVTDQQKAALQDLYQQQQYQPVINVIEQTDDVFAMLARTPEATKKTNEATLTKMSQAFSVVTGENITETTENIHTFIKGIAPSNFMSDADLKQEVLDIVEKKYGPLFQKMAAMQKLATQPQQSVPNMFMGG